MSESPGGFVQAQVAGPIPRAPDSAGLGWELGICIPNKFPGDADAYGPRRMLPATLK